RISTQAGPASHCSRGSSRTGAALGRDARGSPGGSWESAPYPEGSVRFHPPAVSVRRRLKWWALCLDARALRIGSLDHLKASPRPSREEEDSHQSRDSFNREILPELAKETVQPLAALLEDAGIPLAWLQLSTDGVKVLLDGSTLLRGQLHLV